MPTSVCCWGVRPGQASRGFTVFELLAVMAIAGVFVAMGVPMLSSFMQSSQVRATATELVGDLQFARSEAVKRNGTVALIPVNPGSWTSGWRVYAGADATAPVLRARLRNAGQIQITSAANSFVFSPNGRIEALGAVASVQFCPVQAGATVGRVVEVQLSGLARTDNLTGCGP
ncbi:MAG TPA: GspH/FimT family pseudopilin [Burkholderiaceae bacterium]|nr:GspH/FimT family pseudopilin [Burkholderiaceae bacterium]